MKTQTLLLGGALLCALPAIAQTHDHNHGAMPNHAMQQSAPTPQSVANPDFAAAQKTWADVRTQTAELDALVAANKLDAVHDAALTLRDTARELRFGWDKLAPAQRSHADEALRQLDGLLDSLHESADHNNARGVASDQRLLHVTLDKIAMAFPPRTLEAVGPIEATGPVKDPFCRMTVDPSTAAARVAYGGQMYYFCAAPEAEQFKASPEKYVKLYDEIAWGTPPEFEVSVGTNGGVRAGKAANLVFAVREKGVRAIVKDFQPVHEKLYHLIAVSDDLSWFGHLHPAQGADGKFYLKTEFPHAGKYRLYSDFTPQNGGNTMAPAQIHVKGAPTHQAQTLAPDKTLSKTVSGIQVDLKLSAPLRAGETTVLTYTLSKNGQIVTNMTPYLAAMGHMMAVSKNGENAVHTHAVHAGSDPRTGLEVTSQMVTQSGPTQSFKLELPTMGLYKIWAQFGIGGEILTVPFTFNVAPTTAATAPDNAQKITLSLPLDYRAQAATVQAGKPVALTFKLTKDAGCGNTISLPAANWSKTLKIGESATVVYTPTKSGALNFQCGMGHMKGTLLVK